MSIFGLFFPLNLYLQLLEEKGQGHNLMNLDVSLIWVSLQPLGKTLPYVVKRVMNREPGAQCPALLLSLVVQDLLASVHLL